MLKEKFNKLKKSTSVVNSFKLVSANTGAQVISFATAPVLYRIYDKADYGTIGLYMAICGTLSIFSTFEFNQLILLEKTEESSKTAVWLVRLINLIFSVAVLIIVLFFGDHIVFLLDTPQIKDWLILIPISIFFGGQSQILRSWANRHGKYSMISLNDILTSILVPFTSIAYGLIYNDVSGLFIGLIISQVAPTVFLQISLRKNYKIELAYFKLDTIKKMINLNKDFALFSTPSEFINRFTHQLPVFMLTKFASIETVGIYNLCNRMLSTPIGIVSNSVGMIFKQRASKAFNNDNNFVREFKNTFFGLFLIAIIPFGFLLILGPTIFSFVFGDNWTEAGVIAQLLTGMFFLKFIVSPLSYSFIIRSKLREDMLWHFWILLSNFLVFLIGFNLSDDYQIILFAFGLNYMSIYLLYFIRSYQFSKG